MAVAALYAKSFAQACALLAAQTAADGTTRHLVARDLLVGTALAPAARALVVPRMPPDADAAATAGALTVMCEPRIPPPAS